MNSNHWKSLAVFVLLVLVVLCCWSAIGIFALNHYEPKFGGPWENFIQSLWLSLSVAVVSGAGYLAALFLLRKHFQILSSVKQFVVGVISSIAALVLAASGAVAKAAEYLAAGTVSSLVFGIFVAGAAAGVVSILLFSSRKAGSPNQSHKSG